ncbi:MAG TPA: sigma-70 family RNA polymerase sigma factor, partial [Ktedonobacterales bacterium]|nr:sigma-70 family RNA polymerase sigma factor [Ktedonobacterales bacterium]
MSELSGATDEDLLRRIGQGDRAALAEMYQRHGQSLFRYLLHLTPDHQLAEEILQDTLVAVWQSAQSFAAHSSARTWLFGVARRQAHNTLRQRGVPLADLQDEAAQASRAPDPADIVIARLGCADLVAAINRLGPIYREVLALLLVQEMSTAE